MNATITPVRRMADLPDDLATNVRSWPHYSTTPDAEDAYESMGSWWDPLTTEGPNRSIIRLTGYADLGRTDDGYRLFILRFNASTFTYGHMTPGRGWLTIGGDGDYGTKAAVATWAAEQHALNLAPATLAGDAAYKAGRPIRWWTPGKWGSEDVTDPGMAHVVWRVWGLSRHRLGAAFQAAWKAAAYDDADAFTRLVTGRVA